MSTETEDRLRRLNAAQAAKMAEMRVEVKAARLENKDLRTKNARLRAQCDDYRRRLGFREEQRSYIAIPASPSGRASADKAT